MRINYETVNDLIRSRDAERAKVKALREALERCLGWIDSWSPEFTQDDEWPEARHSMNAALAATSDPIEAPSDVHPQESGQ